MDLAVTNGHVYRGGGFVECDVGVVDGEIVVVGDVSGADEVVDASRSYVVPGLVNAHTHAPMALLRGISDAWPVTRWLEGIYEVERHLRPGDVYDGTRLALLEMLRSGTTAFAEMYFHEEEILRAVRESGIRARIGIGLSSADKSSRHAAAVLDEAATFVDRLRAEPDRIRPMLAPHAPYTCDRWFLHDAAELARDLECPLHTHFHESTATVEQLRRRYGRPPAAALDDVAFWDADTFVAHGVHLEADTMELFAEKGVEVAHCPTANMKLRSGIAPVADMFDAGVCVGLGTDGASSNDNLDMLEATKQAALLSRVGDSNPVDVESAFAMATRHGAEAIGIQSGVIREGAPADLVVVDGRSPRMTPAHDPLANLVYSASGTDVQTVIVDGRPVVRDGDVLVFDEAEVVRRARRSAADLRRRCAASGATVE